MRQIRRACLGVATVALLALALPASAQIVLYTQAPDASGIVFGSQNDTRPTVGLGNLFTTFDNFTIEHASTIQNVQWQGGFFLPATHGNITGFTLTFYSDSAAQPGSVLSSETIAGSAGETAVGTEGSALVFNYSANLPTPFTTADNTTYWLSIVADLPLVADPTAINPGLWGWHESVGGDGKHGQTVNPVFSTSPLTPDLAFTLSGIRAEGPPAGGSVPETPGGWVMLLGSTFVVVRYCKMRRVSQRR
jgi:hypothetical protein